MFDFPKLDLFKIKGNGHSVPLVSPNRSIPKVLVVACLYHDMYPETATSLTCLTHCQDQKMTVKFKAGDALIDRSRSIVASRFLDDKQNNFDVLFFVDGDIVFDHRDLAKITMTMMSYDFDICGAAYVKKKPDGTHPNIKMIEKNAAWPFGKKGGVFEVKYVSTGFMGIKKRVFEKMVEKELVHLCHPNDFRFYPFFMPYEKKIDDHWVYLSEDWAFCQRAIDLGFKIWCDSSVRLTHIGDYPYTFDDCFRENKPVIDNFRYWENENCQPQFEVIK